MTRMNPLPVAIPIFCVFIVPYCQSAVAQMDTETVRFVGEVLIGTEFGAKRDQVCKKWINGPRLSTFGPESHHPAIVSNVIQQINECLPMDRRIANIGPNIESANLKLYFVPLAEFEQIAKKHNFAYVPQNHGFFSINWNDKYEIVNAVVLIANDKLRDRKLSHYVIEELTQVMGLPGDSSRFKDSVFYEESSKGDYGTATRLSSMDKKLIRFLYQHVDPGMHPVELGILMTKKWDP